MTKKRKSSVELKVNETPKVASGIAFREFFSNCVRDGLVRSTQEREIHAFFRDLGLKDKEPSDLYREALAKY